MSRRTATAAAALAALLTLTTACGNDDPKTEPTNSPSPTPTTSKPATPKDQAVGDATKALDRYFDVKNEMAADASIPLNRLKTVAISVAPGYTEQEIKGYRKNSNITRTGGATYEIDKILDVSLDNSNPRRGLAPTVQMQVCWDVSEVEAVDEKGNSVINPDRLDRSIAAYWVTNYNCKKNPHGAWKLSSFESKMEKPC